MKDAFPRGFPMPGPEFRMLTQHIYRIATEHGLDAQNYICKTCDQHYWGGPHHGMSRVADYTHHLQPDETKDMKRAYYCSDCFCPDPTNEYCVIPARVIYNWDFRRYSVSHKASEFLSQVHLYPMFDISLINPKIYSVVEEMSRLKELRVQLNFLQAYLLTCKGNAVESLQKQIWPREYLYENIHLYSLADLIQASSGVLESTLQKVVDSSKNHILSCTLCIQKGFICEICKDPKVIFPFDLDKTYRCKDCCSVYHDKCLQAGQLCPKCLRIQQRLLSTDSS
ncbi:myoblast differentiation [Homalodisca vitripennis]|nr:myoblast differentiation [Homalodisca vitripennis]